MKKTLFSLAFVAASGAYVVAANHAGPSPDEGAVALDTAAVQTPTAPVMPVAPSVSVVAVAPPASAVPLASSSQAAPFDIPSIVAQAEAAVAPPLPRPRPLLPAPVSAQPVATTGTTADPSAGGLRDGTYTGSNENAYYGRVQVQVIVANHRVANIKVLDYPQDRRTSRYINSQALPLLKREAISADSASIDTVSGATLTSEAYIRSLGRALAQAGGANA